MMFYGNLVRSYVVEHIFPNDPTVPGPLRSIIRAKSMDGAAKRFKKSKDSTGCVVTDIYLLSELDGHPVRFTDWRIEKT